MKLSLHDFDTAKQCRSPPYHRRARLRRSKARSRVWDRRAQGLAPLHRDLALLEAHHSVPRYQRFSVRFLMGRKQNNKQWEGQQWHDYNASGKWQLWPGSRHARQQASQQEMRYDAMEVSTSQAQAKEDVDLNDVGSVMSQRNRAIQQALTKAKKADGRARKLKEERERREAQWKAFAKSMQARYVRNREQYEADLLRLDEELQATKRQGAEAADLVTAIVTGQIPEVQDAGMELLGPPAIHRLHRVLWVFRDGLWLLPLRRCRSRIFRQW